MDKEFDIVKIIKQLRNLRILLRERELIDPAIKLSIDNKADNLIFLDSEEELQKAEQED